MGDLEPTFERMYAEIGRPSIPPEHLLKSCLLMALYSIWSERQFCERLRYDLLFKWFLGLNVEDEPFDHSSFAKNRKRLLDHRVRRWWPRRNGGTCFPRSISRWTELSWNPGLR